MWSAAGSGGEEAKWLQAGRIGVASVLRWMPGGKRTDRISERDLEVLEFVARFGTVPREVVALWAGTGKAVTAARERRLRLAGLVEVLPGVGDTGRLVLCTRDGLRAVFRGELPVPRFSPGTVRHTAVVARVAVRLSEMAIACSRSAISLQGSGRRRADLLGSDNCAAVSIVRI